MPFKNAWALKSMGFGSADITSTPAVLDTSLSGKRRLGTPAATA